MNDARGHEVGDAILKQIAERLEGLIGPGDALGRFGGDEFVVVLGQQPTVRQRFGLVSSCVISSPSP